MAISTWKPGTLYLPGSLVIPVSGPSSVSTAIPNAGFESGDTAWTKGTGWTINAIQPFAGTQAARYLGPGVATIVSSTKHAVTPGKSITAKCMIQHGASADGQANAAVILEWYNAANALISTSTGNVVSTGAVGVYKQSTVIGVAPALAAKVSIGATGNNNWAALYADNFSWDYVAGATTSALAYKAIQAAAGLSGLSEPAWPTTVSLTVVDNAVTWECVASGSVTWEASSVLTSGGSEPTWPTETGAFISDNNIAWEAVPLRITDEHCPNSKVVAIAASKVFAGDSDVVRFCATLNARDWTTQEDAGFLPTGLQQKSQVGVSGMGVYRGNLAVWSPSTFQVWQVDPDPAAMALLDAMEGIGTTHQQAVQPVSDDLFFLAALGVRTVSITEGSNNLGTGDAGVPIDILIQAETTPNVEPIATYYPGAGQYWLAFRLLTFPILAVGAYWLTSNIYPIESNDSIAWSAAVTGGIGQGVNVESVDFSSSHLASELKDVKLTSDVQIESLDFGGDNLLVHVAMSTTHLDSELKDVKIVSSPQIESVDFSSGHLDSTLEFALVRHTNPNEDLDWSGRVTGGTRT